MYEILQNYGLIIVLILVLIGILIKCFIWIEQAETSAIKKIFEEIDQEETRHR